MLGPIVPYATALLKCSDWPCRELLQTLVSDHDIRNNRGLPLRLVALAAGDSYEERIDRLGEMQVREHNWHDLFNVLAWLAYPKIKAILNARHSRERALESTGSDCMHSKHGRNRSRVRDALTLFDESGVIVASSDPRCISDLRGFRWKSLFWERRAEVASAMAFYVVGHGLFEKALAPYIGLTGHALIVSVDQEFFMRPRAQQVAIVDADIADRIAGSFASSADLAPLPLLGVPGWWRGNERESFYDNALYFRAGRSRFAAREL
jgi:hypothetical protein